MPRRRRDRPGGPAYTQAIRARLDAALARQAKVEARARVIEGKVSVSLHFLESAPHLSGCAAFLSAPCGCGLEAVRRLLGAPAFVEVERPAEEDGEEEGEDEEGWPT